MLSQHLRWIVDHEGESTASSGPSQEVPVVKILIRGFVYPRTVTRDDYNEFCRGLVATTFVNQWGDADVWKVGGKVFAIGHDNEETGRAVFSVKVAPEDFELLSQQEGYQPAPYLASRGMKWVQYMGHPGIDDVELREHLEDSHLIVSQGLSKKKQRELGLLDPDN